MNCPEFWLIYNNFVGSNSCLTKLCLSQSLRGGHRKTGANLHEISKMAAVSGQWCISTRLFLILVILSTSANVHGWDSIDLELFDLVEEVKDNFYGVLGLKQVSTVVYFGWLTGRILFG